MSAPDLLAKALKEYEREVFFEELNAGYAALRADAAAWQDIQAERDALNGTLLDGLKDR